MQKEGELGDVHGGTQPAGCMATESAGGLQDPIRLSSLEMTHQATYPRVGANGRMGPLGPSTGRATTQAVPIGHLRAAVRPGRPHARTEPYVDHKATPGGRTDGAVALRGPPRQRAAGSHLQEGAAARPRTLGYMRVPYPRSGHGLVKLASTECVMTTVPSTRLRTTTDRSLGCLRRQHGGHSDEDQRTLVIASAIQP